MRHVIDHSIPLSLHQVDEQPPQENIEEDAEDNEEDLEDIENKSRIDTGSGIIKLKSKFY